MNTRTEANICWLFLGTFVTILFFVFLIGEKNPSSLLLGSISILSIILTALCLGIVSLKWLFQVYTRHTSLSQAESNYIDLKMYSLLLEDRQKIEVVTKAILTTLEKK